MRRCCDGHADRRRGDGTELLPAADELVTPEAVGSGLPRSTGIRAAAWTRRAARRADRLDRRRSADVVEVAPGADAGVAQRGGGRSPVRRRGFAATRRRDTAVGLIDLDGDGLADLVRVDVPAPAYQPRTAAGLAAARHWSRSPVGRRSGARGPGWWTSTATAS